MALFVDMDGVLADFDSGYEAAFGVRPSIHADNVDWELVRARKHFYLGLPPMPDFQELWSFIAPLRPVVLTGVPLSVVEASDNKRLWARRWLGDTEIRTCRSSEKYLHAKPGDILIDDWEKYKKKWIKAGGIWITHTSATNTITELTKRLNDGDINERAKE
jgi:hypothetical protein